MTTVERLLSRARDAMAVDANRLRARIERARSRHAATDVWQKIASDVDRSAALRAARAAGKPRFTYPADLPVAQRAGDIAAAIRDHPVIIVSGETGSGKTTQ
ncbi:MAG: hypothetical protein M3R40_04405, partial [Pseudomonadota bacterium]|nr:hypothetical protein [Pseudomonadota bacterium]